MFLDLLGLSVWSKVSHVALFNYTLINDGPPLNDNDSLRDITGCPPTEWAKVKRELLGKGWLETPKYFLHRGTIKTLNEAKEIFVGNQNQTAAASRKTTRHILLPPSAETGIVTYFITDTVTPVVTPPVTATQLQSQPQAHGKKEGLTSKPSLEGGMGEISVPSKVIGIKPLGPGQQPFKVPLLADGSPNWHAIGWTPFRPGSETELAVLELTMEVLGGQWVQNSICWGNRIYGSDKVKAEPERVRRIMEDVREAEKRQEIKTTPAQYAAYQWTQFK